MKMPRESLSMIEQRQLSSSFDRTSSTYLQQLEYEDRQSNTSRSRISITRLFIECIAEFFGTAILVLFGCAAVAEYTLSHGFLASFLSVNIAFGFGAMIGIYIAGPITGAHINPAVSISMLTLRLITPLQCLGYIIAQFLGAFIGAALVFAIYYKAIDKLDHGVRKVTGPAATAGIFGTLPAEDIDQLSLLFDQIISTALLLIAICALSNKRNQLVSNYLIPPIVGLIIIALGTSFGYNCGFPVNPARDFGPRLFSLCVGYGIEVFTVGHYYFWIPLIGPLIGGLIGTWIYHGYSKLMTAYLNEKNTDLTHTHDHGDTQNIICV